MYSEASHISAVPADTVANQQQQQHEQDEQQHSEGYPEALSSSRSSPHARKADAIALFSNPRSCSASDRTPPISNGASESGGEPSVLPASHSCTNETSAVNLELYVVSGDVAAGADVCEEGDGEEHLLSNAHDGSAAEDDDAPPPLTLCTMKAASPAVHPRDLLEPSSPFFGTPLRTTASPPLPPASPSSSPPASSPRRTHSRRSRNSSESGRGSGAGTTHSNRSHRTSGSEPLPAHRPGLAVYAPQHRRLKKKLGRAAAGRKGADVTNSCRTAPHPPPAQTTASLPQPPQPASTQSSTSRAPSQMSNSRTRGASRTPRAKAALAETSKPSSKNTTTATSAMMPAASSKGPVGTGVSHTTEATVHTLGSSSTRPDCVALHVVPLSVSGRLTTVPSSSMNGLSSFGDASHGLRDSNTSLTPRPPHSGVSSISASHLARSQLSTVFCRELSTSLGGTATVTGESTSSIATSLAGGLPQLHRASPVPSVVSASGRTGAAAGGGDVDGGLHGGVSSTPHDGRDSTSSSGGDGSPAPSWSSPTRMRMSPCVPTSALRPDIARPLSPLVKSPESPASPGTASQKALQGMDSGSGEFGEEESTVVGMTMPQSVCSRLPTVLIDDAAAGPLGEASAISESTSVVSSTTTNGKQACGSPNNRSNNTRGSSRTSVGHATPRTGAGQPSDFVVHIQQQQQQRTQQQQQQQQHQYQCQLQPRQSRTNSVHSGHSPRNPSSSSPALPPLHRPSRSQSLQLTPMPGNSQPSQQQQQQEQQTGRVVGQPSGTSVLATARPQAISHNYSLSPSSPSQLQGQSAFAAAMTPLPPSHRGNLSAVEDVVAAAGPSSPGVGGTRGGASPLTLGCFSMASGFASQRASRTGSGIGASLGPTPPLTAARVAAHNTANGQSAVSSDRPPAGRAQRPPLPTSTSSRAVVAARASPLPVTALLPSAVGFSRQRASWHGSDVDSFGAGLGGFTSGGPDTYRSLFGTNEGPVSPTLAGRSSGASSSSPPSAPTHVTSLNGSPRLAEEYGASPVDSACELDGRARDDRAQPQEPRGPPQPTRSLAHGEAICRVEPELPPKGSTRPGGARYRQTQHTGLAAHAPH